jgi:hypothetical protein
MERMSEHIEQQRRKFHTGTPAIRGALDFAKRAKAAAELPVNEVREKAHQTGMLLKGATETEQSLINRVSRMTGARDKYGWFQTAQQQIKQARTYGNNEIQRGWEAAQVRANKPAEAFKQRVSEAQRMKHDQLWERADENSVRGRVARGTLWLDRAAKLKVHLDAINMLRQRRQQLYDVIENGPRQAQTERVPEGAIPEGQTDAPRPQQSTGWKRAAGHEAQL